MADHELFLAILWRMLLVNHRCIKSEHMLIYVLREFGLFYILELLMVRYRSKSMG